MTIDDANKRLHYTFLIDPNQNIYGKRFFCFEPLLTPMDKIELDGIDWIIIGGLTPKPVHKNEWIDDIVERADALKIPVFIKKNARYPIKREEFPK